MTLWARQVRLLSGLICLLATAPATAGEPTFGPFDPAARLSPAGEASEYWNLTARFDSGHRLFARFGITNEGPGDRTAGALWYLVHPDGHVSEFRNGRSRRGWTLSSDRLYIDVASSTLDLHGPVRSLELDTTSQGGKIDLHFPAADLTASAAASADRLQSDTLQIGAPIEGTIWERGMAAPVAVQGTTTLSHVWMDESLPELLQRHVEFVGASHDTTVYLSDFTTSAQDHRSLLLVQRHGAAVYDSRAFALTIEAPSAASEAGTYPLPVRLVARSDEFQLEIGAPRLLHRTNPLAAVPQPFRFLFSLTIDPRFVWAEAPFRLTFTPAAPAAPRDVEGQGTLAVIYVNPSAPR